MSNNDIFLSVEESKNRQNELDIIENEIQNYQDEIYLEKQKQAKLQRQINSLLTNTKLINDQEISLNEEEKDPIWLKELHKKLQHYQKIQQILKLQIEKVEIELSTCQGNTTNSQDEDQDKESLLETLKEDLKNVNNELDQLRSQVMS